MKRRIEYVYVVSSGNVSKVGCSVNPVARSRDVAQEMQWDVYETNISKPMLYAFDVEQICHISLDEFLLEGQAFSNEVFSVNHKAAIAQVNNAINTFERDYYIDKDGNITGHVKRQGRNAGRKPNGYESKTMRVPNDLIPSFKAQIETYKLEVEKNAKHTNTNASETS